jgi:hypothetical protein
MGGAVGKAALQRHKFIVLIVSRRHQVAGKGKLPAAFKKRALNLPPLQAYKTWHWLRYDPS